MQPQRRRRRSGWSGLGRTTFQRVVGVVPRLQRRSEDETIGPGVTRKLAFAVRARVSRNRSRSFTSGSGPRRGPTGLHRHPHVAKYTWAYDVQLLAIWRIPLLAVVLLSLALRVGLLRRLSTSPCLSLRPFGKKNVVYRSFQPSWFASWLHYLPVVDPPPPVHMHE